MPAPNRKNQEDAAPANKVNLPWPEVLAQVRDAIICADCDGTVIYWNEAACRLWGWSAEEMMGQSVFERLPPGPAREWGRERFDAVLAGEESFGDRHDYRKDGSRVWIEVRSTGIKDASGQPLGILTIGRDITERKLAEEKVRQSEATMAAAQRLAHFGSWELDLTSRDLDANPLRWSDECFRIFGFEPGGVVTNELFFSRVPVEDHERIRQAVTQAITERNIYSIEHRVILPGGEMRYVHEQAKVLVDEQTGQAVKMVGTVQDITERKRVMQELVAAKETAEAAVRAKSEFLAMISHEIRTPLNPILGAAQLLMDEKSTPEQQELLRIIHNAGEHLLTLLSDLLDLAKMESGTAHLAQSPCRVGVLAQGVLDIKREQARGKQLALKLELDPALAFAYVIDEPRLRQILLNLVGNAVKFTTQGAVTVRADRLDGDGRRDHLRLSVSDTGIGIASEHLQSIFEPFYQVDSSLMRQHEGAGLGLAICRRLVEIMGGEIGVESRLNVGSTFWFTLWLERRHSLDEIGTPWPMPITSMHRHRVLLASADENERILLATALEKAECEVTRVASGADVLALFTPGNFDLLLIDQQLPMPPEYEWPQLVNTLHEREAAAAATAVSIILLAPQATESALKAAQAAGATGILSKPVRLVELLRMLARFAPLPSPAAVGTMRVPSKRRV